MAVECVNKGCYMAIYDLLKPHESHNFMFHVSKFNNATTERDHYVKFCCFRFSRLCFSASKAASPAFNYTIKRQIN